MWGVFLANFFHEQYHVETVIYFWPQTYRWKRGKLLGCFLLDIIGFLKYAVAKKLLTSYSYVPEKYLQQIFNKKFKRFEVKKFGFVF
jgi:hypothetical protein